MSTNKIPVYRIYFYLVILFFTSTVLASSGIGDFFDFDQKEVNTGELNSDNLLPNSKAERSFFIPPPFVDDSSEHVAFTQTCFQVDDSTQFYAVTDENDIVRYSWNFGTGNVADTSNQKNPFFFYQAPGNYDVVAKFFTSNGDSITIDTTVIISPEFQAPNLMPDTAICPDQFPFTLKAYQTGTPPAGAKYIWSNGDTTETTEAVRPGNFWVAVTVGTCTKVEEVEVTEYGTPRKRAAVWHFGEQAGINFNTMQPNDSAIDLNAPEGSATISDIDGRLIFYTDGNTIYNRDHEKLKNGDSIGGSPTSTQSSIIMPWPSRMPYYFLFTTQETTSSENQLSVSLIDMKGDSADGEVVYKNNLVIEPVTEKLTAFALKDGEGVDSIYWLVTQEANSGAFKVFKIDSTGINQPPQTFDFGRPVSAQGAEGQIKISTTGNYMAVAMGDKVDLYNFNDSTGEITDSVSIDLGASGAYGVEFSPDGNKLYVSNSAGIYEIDIADSTGTRLPNDSITSPSHITQIVAGSNFGALQIGPDNRIYVATPGASSLGTIEPAGQDSVVFNPAGFALSPGTTSAKGLPNFVQSFIEPPQGPGLGYQDACGPGTIAFFGSGWGDRDDFSWTILQNGSSIHSQAGRMLTQIERDLNLGTYVVQLRITNDCDMDTTLWDTLTVVGGPKPINLGGPFTLCAGGSQILDAGAIEADEEYIWSTGETTQTITVTQPGTYTVAVLKSNGCAEVAQAVVSPPTFGDIIGDTVLCQGEVSTLRTASPGLVHQWSRLGPGDPSPTVIGNANFINVNTPGQYIVRLSNGNCTDTDTVTVTVSLKPIVVPNVQNAICGSRTGVIQLIPAAGSPQFGYQWFDQNNNVIAGENTEILDQAYPGIYKAIVSHPQGCDSTYTIALSPSNATLTANSGAADCSIGGLNVNVTLSGTSTAPYVFEMYNQVTNQLYTSRASQPSPNWAIPAVPEGVYFITVRDNGGCTYSLNDITVGPSPSAPRVSEFEPPQFTCQNTFTYNAVVSSPLPGYTYSWVAYDITTPSNKINVGSQPTLTATEPAPTNTTKTINYIFTATNNNCQKKDTLTVTYVNFEVALPTDVSQCISQGAYVITPTFTPSIPASVSNNFAYTWTSTDPAFRSTAASIAVLQSGTYTLSVTDNRTGCTATDNQQVTISPTPVDNLGRDITEGCEGDISPLDAGNNGPNTTYLWRGPGVTGSTAQTVNASVEGQYIVDVTLGSCTRSFDILVNRNPPPVSNLPTDTLFCSKRTPSVRLVGGPAVFNQSYSWLDSATGSQVSDVFDVNIIKGGTYYLTIIDRRGCITRDTIRVLEECEGDLFVGDAFTPNGDSKNDVLQFKGEDIGFFDVSIFNRWGQLIYNGTNALQGWDGRTSNGKDAPSGTYVYVVNYKSTKGDINRMFKKKGSVVLIR